MQGSVAIAPNPVGHDGLFSRQTFGLSFPNSVHQFNGSGSSSIARCLFGPPDPKQAKDLVREVELKNALNFGKRFNFDIVNGEPFPYAKKMKMSPIEDTLSSVVNDSDEENGIGEGDGESYIWTEVYDQDYMAKCNRHAKETTVIGPNRHAVSLLYAPTVHSFSSVLSPPSCPLPESPTGKAASGDELKSGSISATPMLSARPSFERNNNVAHNNKNERKDMTSGNNKRNSQISNLQTLKMHQPTAKKSSLSSTHNLITKYANRVLKHAVIKKTRKSAITDFLQTRRMKNGTNQAGKKKQY